MGLQEKSDHEEAERLLDAQEPDFLIGSPPCTGFCVLNWNLIFPRMDQEQVADVLRDAREHLSLMIRMYWKQLAAGIRFLHEHPETARSWSEKDMVDLVADPRVGTVVSDQCEYGLVTPDERGQPIRAKKPTKWASSPPRMLKRLSRRCQNDHPHQHLLGGRAKDAALYPLPLIVEILRGMRDEIDHKHHTYDPDEATFNMVNAIHIKFPPAPPTHQSTLDSEKLASKNAARTCKVHYLDGAQRTTTFDFKPVYKDEYTQEELDPELARAAMMDELQYFNDTVWRFLPKSEADKLYPNATFLGGRCVNHNKGESLNPKVRCRFVATEVAKENNLAYYASTPPLDAIRLLASQFAKRKTLKGTPLAMSFRDATKAYFNAVPTRVILIRAPPRAGPPTEYLWQAYTLRIWYKRRRRTMGGTLCVCIGGYGVREGGRRARRASSIPSATLQWSCTEMTSWRSRPITS